MKKALFKDTIKEIKKTYKRFISILLMAALGVGFFAGVRATSPDMELTIDKYFDNQNVYDLNVISTLGLTDEDLKSISNVDGVEKAVGIYTEDVYVKCKDEEVVVKTFGIEENINQIELLEGSLPINPDECIIETDMKTLENINLGDYIDIREDLDEDEEPTFKNTNLKVVGIGRSPLYLSTDRGTTTLGNGKIAYIVYVNKNNIDSDIYTEIDIIAKDARKYNTLGDEEYKTIIDNIETNLEEIKDERQVARYNELISEATEKLDEAQDEFDTEKADAEKKIADAEKEIVDGKKELQDAENDLSEGRKTADKEINDAKIKLDDAQNQIILNQEALDDNKIFFEAKKKEAEDGIKQIEAGIAQIEQTLTELNSQKSDAENVLNGIKQIEAELNSKNAELNKLEEKLSVAVTEEEKNKINEQIGIINENIHFLEAQKVALEQTGITQDALNQIETGIATCNTQKAELEMQIQNIKTELAKGENELTQGQLQLNDAWNKIQSGKAELETKKADLEMEFADAEKEIKDAKAELADGEKELAEKKIEFETEIRDAEKKLIDAREKVNDIEVAKWYIQDRTGNSAFNSYSQDTENIERIGEVFPIVFFIIATLISLTSMSRMVEEQRVQIRTLKALGYSRLQIMSKYIIYSLLASVVGGFLGASFGLYFFPAVIISMYQMMYELYDIVLEFNVYYTTLGMGIMTGCIVGATIYTAYKELVSTPAEMMRPKAPKAGKRVLLERIPFIWKHLNFTQKVTIRNMFRYKKRFLMTIIGIAGCTALILAGFGLRDSVSNVMDFQYVDVYDYDMMISLKNTLTDDEISSLITKLEQKKEIKDCVPVYMSAEDVKNDDLKEEAQIVVTNNQDELQNVIRLKELEDGIKLNLSDNGVIITDKLAQLVDAEVGQKIILSDSDGNEYEVNVEGITEHYISHYVYMTDEFYNKTFNDKYVPNILLTQYEKELSDEEENNLSEELLLNSKVMAVTLTEYLMTMMDETLESLNLVVYVLIVSAGLLAFIVLYNLSNVNISERIRELATIKVLGFYDKEVYDYVTREIVLLTIIGILIGLVLGIILNTFILGTCEVGMLRFKKIVLPQSYIYSALITIVFTYIINFMTYFSLKKIDMIESLKSVE